MSSLRASVFSLVLRAVWRRKSWADERALARRARRLLAVTLPLSWAASRRVRIEPARESPVPGEWVLPERYDRGTILYLHGGGFVSGSPRTHRPITVGLATRSRRRVFALDYRLAPEHRFPAAIEDAATACRWLLETEAGSGPLAIAGDSAGGGLALALLLALRDRGSPLPSQAVCFSPWTDLAGTGESLSGSDGYAFLRPENIVQFSRIYLGDVSPLEPHASPVYGNLAGLPPILLQVGTSELFFDDTRRIHDGVLAVGGTCRLEAFEGVFHGWQMLDGLLPEASDALDRAASFLNEGL